MVDLVVTRHKTLVEYLKNNNIISKDCEVIEHASAENVKDKDVIGVLPHSLSCLTNTFTEIVLNIPFEKRGMELTLEEIEKYILSIKKYKVKEIK
ncbi:CRISPR-associated protein Csx16 [Streptobacillus canis]|uniref:CRISPR-associated protein Csx16 n=1 Tax=Streptobacillus canis TaxID=2678686 RepID=UPI0012E25923|nr:CRISPR-associated protein Csx16 [Streptobacillus canis]